MEGRRILLCTAFLLCSIIFCNAEFDISNLSWETLDELEQLEDVFGYAPNFTGKPCPIYREDLPNDYVAYWELEINETEFVIISSSEKTGDYRLTQEGPLPSPITLLDNYASLAESECHRYYMLSPAGQMICRNNLDEIVAITTEISPILMKDVENTKMEMDELTKVLVEQKKEIQEEWDQRRVTVEQSGVWSTISKYDKLTLENDDENDHINLFYNETYSEQAISPGEKIYIPLGNAVDELIITVVPINISMRPDEMFPWQLRLCQALLDVCDTKSYKTIDENKLHVDAMGRRVLVLELHEDSNFLNELLEETEIGFHIEIHFGDGEVVLRRFGIDLSYDTRHREKRRTERRSWTGFTYTYIPSENLFPDYNQHDIGGCMSGCGPVAWAMVFGYYDRMAHYNYRSPHYRSLYRCGSSGTTGSDSCEAPRYMTDTVKGYVEDIRRELGTFCLAGQGATLQSDMDNVEEFYRARQGSRARISTCKTGGPFGLAGFYSTRVADNIIDNLEDGRPVIVGYRVNGNFLAQHYAVATKLRRRSRRYRHCIWWLCFGWVTEWDNDIYLHNGWGGTGNGWRTAEGFFAAVARPT
uniref:Uncharacterized protein LOC102802244 n=1 Tax=Saccoglossus kowalevskii TaxID=10224 RepID=A0ABM0MRQ5_SACKO|nr:PREDICTED: uncharacterized protein LOC102802244 [Saccoglossus kowalevskii]